MKLDSQKTAPTLCLVMIVKNEAKNLKRCFQELKQHIDCWVICDTGSTDNTRELIKEELRDIPGKLLIHKWKNFSHNRNLAIQAAKAHADYLLFCDADEVVRFSNNFKKEDLTLDSYMVRYSGSLDYVFRAIVKSHLDWKYIGVTHEYLSSDFAKSQTILDSVWIDDYGDGGSKSDKFERDVKLLLDGLREDPTNSRYKFYLANSYKDAGNYNEALSWYINRIADGGWIEEVTCSYEYLGECYKFLGETFKAFSTWMEGYFFNPTRAECIYNAAKLSRELGKHKLAYNLIQLGKEIPYPKDDILFIKRDVYKFLLNMELSIVSYYVDPNKDLRELYKQLLIEYPREFSTIISNYKFYNKTIENSLIKSISLTDYERLPGYNNSSPCIIPYNQGYLVNLRRVNYYITSTGDCKPKQGSLISTHNTLLYLNKELQIERQVLNIPPLTNSKPVNGVEDIRLLQIDEDIILYSGNVWKDYQEIEVVIGTINLQTGKVEEPINLLSPEMRKCEKNWSFFLKDGVLNCLYDWNPVLFFQIHSNELQKNKNLSKRLPNFRGSSNGVEYKDSLYFLTHIVSISPGKPRSYYHCIVEFDKNTLEYRQHSNLFKFEGAQIEFGLGLVVEDSRVLMSYSVWDKEAKINIYDKKKLFEDLQLKIS